MNRSKPTTREPATPEEIENSVKKAKSPDMRALIVDKFGFAADVFKERPAEKFKILLNALLQQLGMCLPEFLKLSDIEQCAAVAMSTMAPPNGHRALFKVIRSCRAFNARNFRAFRGDWLPCPIVARAPHGHAVISPYVLALAVLVFAALLLHIDTLFVSRAFSCTPESTVR
ncbi:MAG TPA: hypothetical protein VHA06_06360 [Candidatus Angelobacter sp.]|nr:hypothetical protein [Candidatus Angelobacter sp.]